MRYLVTGAAGQLGTDLQALLAHDGRADVTAIDLPDLDLTDAEAVPAFVQDWATRDGGDADGLRVLNGAAFTAVDAAEEQEDLARRVNADAVGVLARACSDVGARLVHVSTDYVFDGRRPPDGPPYEPDDPAEPRSAYGRTKLAGEREALDGCDDSVVLRTAWVYGAGGPNFVKTMARLEQERETVSVVDDQRGSPTWSAHLAGAVLEAARGLSGARRVHHVTGGGETTWYGFTRAIFEELGADPERVQPTTTDAFPRPAPRPAYSVLSVASWAAAGGTPLPHWRDALAEAFATVGDALRA